MLPDPSNLLLLLVALAELATIVVALVDCVRRPPGAFPAHGKLTKQIWLVILGVGLLLTYLTGPLGLFALAGTVAGIVYLVDVRPAVRG